MQMQCINCTGLTADACGAKMDAHRDELLAGFAEAGSDFIPVYGRKRTVRWVIWPRSLAFCQSQVMKQAFLSKGPKKPSKLVILKLYLN
ncbi:hypothetical protein ACH50_06620 [Franconibacter pulveris]|uniref:Uncharacterized protein n=1 Tax=Franconibacter pulveris TaxID=435910 RepID=A0A0J8VQW2_9ENTR|nr:hypothetical protein ACH50_06620 [Franconibacter pulveris]